MKVVIESPLRGKTKAETRENLRFLLWCCRSVYLAGYRPIASHLVCPWFMDDHNENERADGIDWPWMWEPGVAHWSFTDLTATSPGMQSARNRCFVLGMLNREMRLETFNPDCWAAYQRGEWPPHTEGFGFDE